MDIEVKTTIRISSTEQEREKVKAIKNLCQQLINELDTPEVTVYYPRYKQWFDIGQLQNDLNLLNDVLDGTAEVKY